jgi:hypothetical protein
MASLPARGDDTQKLSQPNRRRSARLPPRAGIACTIIGAGGTVDSLAQVIDISQTGVRLLSQQRFESGTRIQISMSNAADLFSHRVGVIVRFAVGTSDGNHVTGCEFSQRLTYDELRALLA